MIRDNRLSSVLHVLLHMTEYDRPVTSEGLAKAMDTNRMNWRLYMRHDAIIIAIGSAPTLDPLRSIPEHPVAQRLSSLEPFEWTS